MPTKNTASRQRTATTKKTGSRRSKLSNASTAALHAEIERRLRALEQKREALSAELDALDNEIAACAGAAASSLRARNGTIKVEHGARPRKRPRNEMNLVDALKKLLKRRTLSVSEMAVAVQQAGYRTSSPNFRTIVNQTLINNKRDFKRVSRGRYTVRGK